MTQRQKSHYFLLLALFLTQVIAKKLGALFIAENDVVGGALPFIRLQFFARLRFDLHNHYGIALGIEKPSELLLFDDCLTFPNETL